MINPLDERYIGSVCEIRSFNNDILALGVVKEVGDDFIEISPRDEFLRLFNTTSKLKLNVFNSKAGFNVLICEVLTSSEAFLKVVNPIQIIDHERRSAFRVAVDMYAKISHNNVFQDEVEPEHIQIVMVKDMSICGLRIFSKRKFLVNQILWLEITLDNSPIVTRIQIMREYNQITNRDGSKTQEYGIRLIFNKSEDNDKLCSYIFKRQREISNKIR